MWTPKRILLLSAGLVLFIAGYSVYAFFLGGIDGLRLLPEAYERTAGPPHTPLSVDSEVDRKLQLAFGQQCPQAKQPYKFEDRKKGLVVAAAETSFGEPDGRVKLTDFSVAIFKDHADGGYPEINTITSNYAFLEFDVKIKDPTDMSKGKIIAGELRGNIVIINNHRTPAKHDDLEVLIDNEPLMYEENKALVWTNGLVHLLDKQTQPHPTKIDGQGMELYLVKNQPADKKQPAAAAKPKNDLSGVDKIILKSAVMMHLYPDASSGFMTGANPPPKDVKKQAPMEKAHVIIKTMGQFTYDITNDVARFDSPLAKQDGAFYDPVEVTRRLMRDEADKKSDASQDQLICDHLTMKFRRKPVQPGPVKGDKSTSSTDREIESAHATARPGNEVVLSLGNENMACTGCQDLVYESPAADRGARTVLRGESLIAAKDGHKIKAKKLELVAANQKGAGQQIIAEGPGQVDLWDRNPGKGYTSHAIWKGLLTSNKLKDGDRDYDLLTLTEDAAFIDDEQGQKLYGQRLQVKLETNDAPNKTPGSSQSASPETRQLPRMVEAFERVRAVSADMRISDCDHLIIRIKDVVKVASPAPSIVPPTFGQEALAQPQASAAPVVAKEKEKQKDKAKPKQPIDLKARDVVVDVVRGEKNELQELLAVGGVHVHQNGETPKDKGVDIIGDTLSLFHFPEGDLLKVFGDTKPAELQLEDLYLIGPKVTINQKDNTAVVEGAGAMRMPSNGAVLEANRTNAPPPVPKEPAKTAKAPTYITIHWTKDMLFTGRDADFNGGVEAYQDNSTLLCQNLQVAFDKYVSLKEGQKGDQGAKVDKVIAYGQVWVLDKEIDKVTDQIKTQSAVNCKQMDVNNLENQSIIHGPGWVAKVGPETNDEWNPTNQKQAKKDPTKPPQWMLTRIHFTERMFTAQLNAGKTRKTTFLGAIEVIHVPGNRLDAPVDTAKLPPGGMFMQCESLTVLENMGPGTTKSQVMQAEKKVRCWADDIKAVAEIVIFDQTANTVIFRGSPGNLAIVEQTINGPGSPPRTVRAQEILYNRNTNPPTLIQTGIGGIKGELPPEEQYRPLDEWWLDRGTAGKNLFDVTLYARPAHFSLACSLRPATDWLGGS